MSKSSLPTIDRRRLSKPKARRRLLAGFALLLVLAGGVVGTAGALGGAGAKNSKGVVDNSTPTALATVRETALSSQTESAGTLGYAGSFTVVVPGGTPPAAVQQARQAVGAAVAETRLARATLQADQRALATARKNRAADRAKKATDCRRNPALRSGRSGTDTRSCPTATQTVLSDEQTVAAEAQKVTADRVQLDIQRQSVAAARQRLAAAESSANIYDAGAAYTMLPQPGELIRRGRALYGVDDRPVVLLYGQSSAWRAFRTGMTPGPDVADLNANLRALGYDNGPGDRFTTATAQGIEQLQAARRVPATGELPLGSIVFTVGAVRVASVTPTLGSAVQPGPVLRLTSTRHEVTVQLDPSLQADVKVGDRVIVTLPDNSTAPGVISSVGKVATTAAGSNSGSAGSGSSSSPTIEVGVRLLHESAAGNLDQAPVQVAITTASVRNALVVPVAALLALAGGGYAVETVLPTGAHQLVAAKVGLFDDASGLVQINGPGLHVGQRVVVPSS
jgi:hypothetical protein